MKYSVVWQHISAVRVDGAVTCSGQIRLPDDDPVGSKHVGANSVTSVTAYVILYSYIQVHKLVQIKSI